MSDDSQSSEHRKQVVKAPDGEYILARRRGFYPAPFVYYRLPASRIDQLQIVLWLLNAAASGIVGNLAYDYLKHLIEKARKGHQEFLSEWNPQEELRPDGMRLLTPERVIPGPDLRRDLIELAYDAIARYRSQSPEWNAGQMMAIDVYLTENETWAVVMKEAGSENQILVEIPLIEDEARSIYGASWRVEGFPVSIWGSDHNPARHRSPPADR